MRATGDRKSAAPHIRLDEADGRAMYDAYLAIRYVEKIVTGGRSEYWELNLQDIEVWMCESRTAGRVLNLYRHSEFAPLNAERELADAEMWRDYRPDECTMAERAARFGAAAEAMREAVRIIEEHANG